MHVKVSRLKSVASLMIFVMSCDILLPSMSRGCPHVALVEQGCPDAPQQTSCELVNEFVNEFDAP